MGWVVVSALLVATVLTLLGARAPSPSFDTYRPSAAALADIPAEYLAIYRRTGDDQGLDWAILAAIGKVETDHGRSRLPGVHRGRQLRRSARARCSSASAPATTAAATPATPGPPTATDGNGDGRRDVYDPADAIPAAARYLRAAGAPGDYRRAIFAYNHAAWYVAEVLATAERYRGASAAAEHAASGARPSRALAGAGAGHRASAATHGSSTTSST